MRTRTVLMWSTAGLLGLFLLSLGSGWWALRKWPEESSPYVPAWLAWQIADFGNSEYEVAERVFKIDRYYHLEDIRLNTQDIAKRHAIIFHGLHGDKSSQLLALRLMQNDDSYVGNVDIKQGLFALTQSADEEVRTKARRQWLFGYDSGLKQLSHFSIESAEQEKTPLTPDQWIPSKEAVIALRLYTFMSAGYDHITPNKYLKIIKAHVNRLMSLASEGNRFSLDDRDNVLIFYVLFELYKINDDNELKSLLQKTLPSIVRDTEKIGRLWQTDTTTAILTALCLRNLFYWRINDNKETTVEIAWDSLRESLDSWLSQFKSEIPPWMSQGEIISATDMERWGAIYTGQYFLNRKDLYLYPTHIFALDPTTVYPLSRYFFCCSLYIGNNTHYRDQLKQHQKLLRNTQILTPNHGGDEGRWAARNNVSSEIETIFSLLELSFVYNHSN